MKYSHKICDSIIMAVKSTVVSVGLAEIRKSLNGAPEHEAEKLDGPLPPII